MITSTRPFSTGCGKVFGRCGPQEAASRSRSKKKSCEEERTMGELVDRLGNKTAGQLIKSADWNELVAAIEHLSATLEERFATVDGRLQELDTKVDALVGDFTALRGVVEPLLDEYYRLTLETTRIN